MRVHSIEKLVNDVFRCTVEFEEQRFTIRIRVCEEGGVTFLTLRESEQAALNALHRSRKEGPLGSLFWRHWHGEPLEFPIDV